MRFSLTNPNGLDASRLKFDWKLVIQVVVITWAAASIKASLDSTRESVAELKRVVETLAGTVYRHDTRIEVLERLQPGLKK